MGKPLSRPDCLRQNPSCVGKGEEEDLNIDDCYVPQRSIYDTVRLNEQIDSGSKGSLSSHHFTGTLPYAHRTLDLSTLCGNGVLPASSSFELRARKPATLDERVVFDGLKLNGNMRVTDTVLPRSRLQAAEKREHPPYRRSWRTFAPSNLGEYTSRSGILCSGSVERPGLVGGRSMTSSLTSEEDSGLYSPTAERERHAHQAHRRACTGTRSLSSSEAMHFSGDLKNGRSLSSEQEFPFSPARDNLSFYHSGSLVQEPLPAQPGVVSGPINGDNRFSSGRSSRTQNGSCGRRSRTLTDYDELSTAELVEDASSVDCELVSVVVTQPETYGNSVTLPLDRRRRRQPAEVCSEQPGVSEYTMDELEEFLQSVEACLPKDLHALQHAGEHELEALLSVIAACPEVDPLTHFSPQGAKLAVGFSS